MRFPLKPCETLQWMPKEFIKIFQFASTVGMYLITYCCIKTGRRNFHLMIKPIHISLKHLWIQPFIISNLRGQKWYWYVLFVRFPCVSVLKLKSMWNFSFCFLCKFSSARNFYFWVPKTLLNLWLIFKNRIISSSILEQKQKNCYCTSVLKVKKPKPPVKYFSWSIGILK